jgi:hypothetical protein
MKTNGLTILHQIKAYLYDNSLTKEDPNDYIAKVSSEHSLNVKQISEMATTRGGADISAAAMERAVNLWLKEMAYQRQRHYHPEPQPENYRTQDEDCRLNT